MPTVLTPAGRPCGAAQRGTPIEAFDAGPELEQLCLAAVRELSLMGAALSLMSNAGSEAVAAVSDDLTRRIEEIQFDLGEGPGRDAFREGRPVLVGDIQGAIRMWPAYAPAVHAAGVGAVFAFPLQLGASRFGVLTFYVDHIRILDSAETTACLIFAEAATETLLDGGPVDPDGTRPSVPSSLRFRTEVYQAQGMVMVDLGIGLADALARMRAHAFATGVDLDVLAREILAGTTRLAAAEEP
jgi:GAF domain-containing protein